MCPDAPTSPNPDGSQPYLHELVVAVRAPTLGLSRMDGQLRGRGAEGFYIADRRVLVYLVVTTDGIEPEPVLGQSLASSEARFVGAVRNLGDDGPDPTVFIERARSARGDGVQESVTIVSRARADVHCIVSIAMQSDLLDIAAVKAGRQGRALVADSVTPSRVSWHGPDGSCAVLTASPAAATAESPARLNWAVSLKPQQRFTIVLGVSLEGDPIAPVILPGRRNTFARPLIESGDHRLAALVEQSVADLNSLAAGDPAEPTDGFLAAGSPWFLTLFGRDSLWAARMALPLGTDVAGGTLRALQRRQGTHEDANTQEQPGKIMHELRRMTFELPGARGNAMTLPPLYYGSVDSTPLWISLLHDAWRWGMPEGEVRRLLPGLLAALDWLRDFALDDSGFVRYVDATGRGLTNQGWKDSHDSVQFRTGALAEPPIALCEVQGYAHLAALHGAALLDAFGLPDADAWRQWAADLASRFRAHFWVPDAGGAYPAIALDGDGTRVDTLTSNIGHLLSTGLLDALETELVVARLASPELDCGFGLRTMSADAHGFNPLSYHCGSVWSHDTAIAISGLAATGTATARAAAPSLIAGLLRAGAAFDYQLPELHGGEAALPGHHPVPYPAACRPQAWSAAAALVVVSSIIGLAPDVPGGVLRLAPLTPSPVGELTVRGLRLGGNRLDLHLSSLGIVEVLKAPELRIEID